MKAPSQNTTDERVTYAFEADKSLSELVGGKESLAQIFSREKIMACQKLLDDARQSFFDNAQADVDAIHALVASPPVDHYQEWFKNLFNHVNNIRGQAEVFGFPLISRVCRYLAEYCESNSDGNQMTVRDVFVIARLSDALNRAFQDRIADTGGALERELMKAFEQVKK